MNTYLPVKPNCLPYCGGIMTVLFADMDPVSRTTFLPISLSWE